MKGNDSILLVSLVSLLYHHLALMPLALGATIGGSGIITQQQEEISTNPIHSSHDEEQRMIVKGGQEIAQGAAMLHLVRHIRSVDHQQQQASDSSSSNNGLMMELQDSEDTNNNSIQSNSESEEETVHKAPKSFVSSDNFPRQPQEHEHQNVVRMQSAPKGLGGHKWLFRGIGGGQQFPPRGLRRDSHFIRFGRNSNMDFGDGFSNLAAAAAASNNNGNKKNNFIRLGRENPRRNNFIRLGRSGLWGNNERFGTKNVGYFPDYYSQLLQGNPNIWDFAEQQPVPFDPREVFVQG